jgi:hypothetical protein
MSDVIVTRSGELGVSGIQAQNEAGIDFVDGWFPTRKGAPCTVVDSGRLVIANQDVDEFVEAAKAERLTVDRVEGL